MGLHWLTAFVDHPAAGAGDQVRFWQRLSIMRSPAGLGFCFVQHHGEGIRPGLVERAGQDSPHVFDQVSIDVPHNAYSDECTFWSTLTGWALHGGSIPDFRVLERAPGMALRILLHRLGRDDAGTMARAHLDAAVGGSGELIAEWHVTLGASIVGHGARWITLTDPAGLPYCLTQRDPVTGTL